MAINTEQRQHPFEDRQGQLENPWRYNESISYYETCYALVILLLFLVCSIVLILELFHPLSRT